MKFWSRLCCMMLLVVFVPTLSGCWATMSELRKERRLREALEEQFRSFKKEIRAERAKNDEKQKQMDKKFQAFFARALAESARLKKLLARLKKQVKQGQGGVAEMFTTLQSLQSNFQRTLGQIGELQKQIKEMVKKRPDEDKRYQELQKRYEELLRNQKALAEQAIPAKLFARARQQMRDKKYAEALKGFKLFIRRFGKHPLADNAYRYIGKIHEDKGQMSLAISSYSSILSEYPRESSVPIALFRLGIIHYKKGLCRRGRKYFSKLTRYRRREPTLAREARNYYRRWKRACKRRRR